MLKIKQLLAAAVLTILIAGCEEQVNNAVEPGVNTTSPSEPRNLISAGYNSKVELKWTPPISNGGAFLTSYKIYRGLQQGQEQLYDSIAGNVTSYYDINVQNATQYVYFIKAINTAGESGASNNVTALPQGVPTPPQNFSAVPSSGYITLSWQPPVLSGGPPVTQYKIYKKDGNGTTDTISLSPSVLSYTDNNTGSDINYSYFISAFNSLGRGEPSDTLTILAFYTPENSNVRYFKNIEIRQNLGDSSFSSINALNGIRVLNSDAVKDIIMLDSLKSFQFFLASGTYAGGFETRFLSTLAGQGFTRKNFDTLSFIPDSNNIIEPSDFPYLKTDDIGEEGLFTSGEASKVFAFYLKGKHLGGQTGGIPVYGLIRIDKGLDIHVGLTFKVDIKINIAGQNSFR